MLGRSAYENKFGRNEEEKIMDGRRQMYMDLGFKSVVLVEIIIVEVIKINDGI